ncbi:MAG: DUF58 domain-containing protein [Acidobacteria bacterium]|nr:DUF58 domain-containing protein [Acidobacteriota bacterium]
MSTASSSNNKQITLFDDKFLKKLEYLNIISKRLFAGSLRAERRTRKRGTGLEFADYRAYVAGDDFRHLDWKAYLRLNRLILKLFEEEEDLPIYFFVDSSQSMNFGDPSKLDYARRVAAALCYIGLANLDRVNIISYSDRVKTELPPQRGKGRIFKVFRFLTDIKPGGETNARESFKTYCTETRRRGLAVVISDFFDQSGFQAALDILRHFRHDIFVIHIASHEELDPALKGELLLVDSENQAAREITITPSLLTAYKAEFAHYCESIESYCWKYQLGYVRTATDFPFEELVLRVFRQGRFLK